MDHKLFNMVSISCLNFHMTVLEFPLVYGGALVSKKLLGRAHVGKYMIV